MPIPARSCAPITEFPNWRALNAQLGLYGNSCYAGVSSDRTNLSPFTKDYRGLALPCDLRVFAARKGAISKRWRAVLSWSVCLCLCFVVSHSNRFPVSDFIFVLCVFVCAVDVKSLKKRLISVWSRLWHLGCVLEVVQRFWVATALEIYLRPRCWTVVWLNHAIVERLPPQRSLCALCLF